MSFSSNRSVNGNISNSVISTGDGANFTVNHNMTSQDSEEAQLRQDLQKLETLLKQLEGNHPQASLEDKRMYVTAGTPKPVRDRLLAALAAGGKATISEFLDNAYARVVMATIEGWRS